MVHYQVRLTMGNWDLILLGNSGKPCRTHLSFSTWRGMKLEYLRWNPPPAPPPHCPPSLAEDCSQGQYLPSSSGLLSGKESLRCSWNGPGGIDWRKVYRGGAGGVDSTFTSSQSPNIQEPSSGFPSSLSPPLAIPVALESVASTRHEKIRQASVQCGIYCAQWVTNAVQGKDSLKTKHIQPTILILSPCIATQR